MISRRPLTRRAFAAAGAAALAAGLITSCSAGGTPASAPSEPLVMTVWGGATDKAVYQQRLDLAKKKYPDIKVELQQISEDYDRKIQTMVAGGNAPDIMATAEQVNVFSSKNQLLDLNPYLDKAGVEASDRWAQATVDAYSTDGKLWAAPDRSGAMVVFYNKALFDDAGVGYPSSEWTWEDFSAAAKKLTKKDGDTTTQYGYAAGDWWPWYMTWMYQNGGEVIDDQGKPVVDSPANQEALQFYHDLMHKDGVAPTPRDYANLGVKSPDALFAQGKLAMATTGFWNVSALAETDLDWGVAPLWHGQESTTAAFGTGLAVSASSDRKDDAAKIVEFLTSEEGQEPIATSGADVPANTAVAKSEAFTSASWLKKPVDLSAFSQSADTVYSPPLIPEFNELTQAFTDKMAPVWNNEKSVKDGLADVQEQLERILR
jgi:multiple sugar transport system substrate-binding protein